MLQHWLLFCSRGSKRREVIIGTHSSNSTSGQPRKPHWLVPDIPLRRIPMLIFLVCEADPDRSNPTRSRWERPLDTIRSFEAAIDGNYSRKSYMRTGQTSLSFNWNTPWNQWTLTLFSITESADSGANFNRRNSYFGGMFLFRLFHGLSLRHLFIRFRLRKAATRSGRRKASIVSGITT